MNDEELGEALRAVLAASDPVPPAALRAACEAIGWRDPDSELARLTAEPVAQLTHLRGGESRLLTFRHGRLVVDLEVGEADDRSVRLVGQLDPPHAADVTVQSGGGSRTMQADSQGRFAADRLPAGGMRVVITSGVAGGGRTATEWFRA